MQIKLFTVSIADNGQQAEELNTFLRSNKILEVENQLVHNDKGAYWCFCVKYIQSQDESGNQRNLKYAEKVDYRTVLDEVTFKKFSVYREIRKKIAQDEGLPAFAVFIDEELANMAKLETLTLQTMASIKGIGEKKIEKFGTKLMAALAQKNETQG
jgi:superfamily II DNA helicase RecQ